MAFVHSQAFRVQLFTTLLSSLIVQYTDRSGANRGYWLLEKRAGASDTLGFVEGIFVVVAVPWTLGNSFSIQRQ